MDQEDPIGHRATKLLAPTTVPYTLVLHKRGHCSESPHATMKNSPHALQLESPHRAMKTHWSQKKKIVFLITKKKKVKCSWKTNPPPYLPSEQILSSLFIICLKDLNMPATSLEGSLLFTLRETAGSYWGQLGKQAFLCKEDLMFIISMLLSVSTLDPKLQFTKGIRK